MAGREGASLRRGLVGAYLLPFGLALAQGPSPGPVVPRPELALQTGHGHYVRTLAFSPNGRLLVSGGEDKAVLLWDLATRRLVRQLGTHARDIKKVAFSPDGALVASAAQSTVSMGRGYNSTVKVCEAETGREIQVIEGEEGKNDEVASVAFAPEGIWIAWAEDYRKLRLSLLEISTKREIRSLVLADPTQSGVPAAAFSADLRYVADAGHDKVIRIWELATGKQIQALSGHQNTIWSVAFSSDGRWLASASQDKTVRLWDVAEGREVHALTGHSEPRQAAFSPSGETLGSIEFNGTAILWDVRTGQVRQRIEPPHGTWGAMAFSPDGRVVATGGMRVIRGWDAAAGTLAFELAGYVGWIMDLALSPDGHTLVSAHYDAAARLWDLRNGLLSRRLLGHDNMVEHVAVSPDGGLVATVGSDQKIKLWEVATGRENHDIPGEFVEGRIMNVGPAGFSPDGKLLATTSHARLRFWDPSTGTEAGAIDTPPLSASPLDRSPRAFIHGLAFSPDKRWLALGVSSTLNSEISVFELSTGRSVGTMPGTGPMAFSPDGRLLAFGTGNLGTIRGLGNQDERSVQLWDVRSFRQKGTVKLAGSLRGASPGAALSTDLRYYAQGGGDNSVHVWNASTGEELHTFRGHTDWISKMEFSADGRWLVSTGLDGSIRFWDVPEGREAALLTSMNGLDEWLVVTPDGLFDGSPEAMGKLVTWRFGSEVRPLELFFGEFYYPGLLAEVLKGKAPKAPRDVAQLDRRQPKLNIVLSDGQTSTLSARAARVKVEVAEAPPDTAHSTGSGARDLRLFRNGSLVKVWRGDVLGGKGGNVTLEATIPIVAGENHLTAYAFNHDNIKSADAVFAITGAESLKRPGTAYILAIGINRYANPDYNLNYAAPDARAFGEELQRQQTSLAKFARVEVAYLLDQDATKANILRALARLAGRETGPLAAGAPAGLGKLKPVQPEDIVFVYYAGHGTAAGPRFYLIPHDLGYTGGRETVDAAALKTIFEHGISDLDLERAFENVDASRLVLVVDACNSGQALEAEEKRRGPMNSRGLAQLAYEKGMHILTAAQGYQAALEVGELGHGLLTYALIEEGLKSPAADTAPTDGQVVLREWLDYATLRVPRLQQTAMQQARKMGRDVAFVGGEETITDLDKRSLQQPRVFYRREPESEPLVVAKPAAKP